MDIVNPVQEYQAKTDDELLRLALDPSQLTSEASAALIAELGRRQIHAPERLDEVRDEERRRKEQQSRARQRWQVTFWFFVHLTAVYLLVNVGTPRLAGWTWGTLLPILQLPSSSSSFVFLFSHLLLFSFIPAFLVGVAAARFGDKTARIVWFVPTAILAYKLVTFRAGLSLLPRHGWPAFQYYFGGNFLIPEFYSWEQFWGMVAPSWDMRRGMDQLRVTAPFYAGVAYSVGAWICHRTGIDRAIWKSVRQWEEQRFGSDRGGGSNSEDSAENQDA